MNPEQKIKHEIWLVLQQLKEDYLLTPENNYAVYEIAQAREHPNFPTLHNQLKILKKLEHDGALKIVRSYYVTRRGTSLADAVDFGMYHDADPKGILLGVLFPRFDELYAEYSQYSAEPITPEIETKKYVIELKDRGVWVNEFLLSRPHATGKNMGFFEYVFEHPDKLISRDSLPKFVQQDVAARSFSKVLNDLGFKGEILKVFFPERGKSQLRFRKEVTLSQLAKSGINTDLLLQELRLAHLKSSPK